MNNTNLTVQFWALCILSQLMSIKQDAFWEWVYAILAILTLLFQLFSKED